MTMNGGILETWMMSWVPTILMTMLTINTLNGWENSKCQNS